MRKYLAVALVALSLGGCTSTGAVTTAINVATKSIQNPVTNQELFQIEASLKLATTGLVTYRRLCLQGNADVNCRTNILAIQPYNLQVPGLVAELRRFVRTNDQVNAIAVYRTLSNIYTNITTEAAARGVKIGA